MQDSLRKTPQNLLSALDLIRSERLPRPESLDSLELRHVERVRKVFDDRNVVAIGIAEKVTDDKATGHLSLAFYVRKKLPKPKGKPVHMIPPVIAVANR